MGRILYGKPVAEKIYSDIDSRVCILNEKGAEVTLLIIRMGARADDVAYEKNIIRNCDKVGIKTLSKVLPADTTQETLLDCINSANGDKSVHGIMIMRPLPPHISDIAVQEAINPLKDVDCISDSNLSKVLTGGALIYPCTAYAVIELLSHYEIPLSGKRVTIAGRSKVVGKPLSLMLLDYNATVTICHSKTEDLAWHTKNANITVAAIGKTAFFGRDYFSEGSIVVDVGVNYDDKTGKMYGDADFEELEGFVTAITPPTGGLGAVTTAVLIQNTVRVCEKQIENNGDK